MLAGHSASWFGLLLPLLAQSPKALFYLDGHGAGAMSGTPTIGIGTVVYEKGIILPPLSSMLPSLIHFLSSPLSYSDLTPTSLGSPHYQNLTCHTVKSLLAWPPQLAKHALMNKPIVIQTVYALINKSNLFMQRIIITHIMTKPYYWDSF